MVSHDICPHRCPWCRRPGCLSAAAPSPSEPPPRLQTLRQHSPRVRPRPAPPETWTKTQAHRPSSPSRPSPPFIHSRASASDGALRCPTTNLSGGSNGSAVGGNKRRPNSPQLATASGNRMDARSVWRPVCACACVRVCRVACV